MAERKIRNGDLLIAEPFTQENEFKKAVLLIADYTVDQGTVGFVLNKPLDVSVDGLIQGFPEFRQNVYYGGPVANDTLHYIHTKGDLIEESMHIKDNLYWSGDFERVKFLIKSGLLTSHDIRFYVGYSGWSAGQLEDELEWGCWLTSQGDANYVFNKENETLWKRVLETKGGRYSVIAQLPENTNLN